MHLTNEWGEILLYEYEYTGWEFCYKIVVNQWILCIPDFDITVKKIRRHVWFVDFPKVSLMSSAM